MADHWDGTDLRERLMDEMGDVIAAIAFVGERNDLDAGRVTDRAETNDLADKYDALA